MKEETLISMVFLGTILVAIALFIAFKVVPSRHEKNYEVIEIKDHVYIKFVKSTIHAEHCPCKSR